MFRACPPYANADEKMSQAIFGNMKGYTSAVRRAGIAQAIEQLPVLAAANEMDH